MPQQADVVVIGGGLIGLATARALVEQAPDRSVTVLEAETGLAMHQSGRNSGVLHSGVYYKPGSFKAELCREGANRLIHFCETHDIAIDKCGKVIVATSEEELKPLRAIHERGVANGLSGLELLTPDALQEIEPHVAARGALLVPEAGIVDFPAVASTLGHQLVANGHGVMTGFRVSQIDRVGATFRVSAESGAQIEADYLVNCAGLQSDRIARLAGAEPDVQIIPFRGEYYVMPKDRDYLVKHLVYPVPDPRFPFLGIHFTRRIDNSVEVGPNAVLALGRHHYRGEARPNGRDVLDMFRSAALWRLGMRYWRTGGSEMIRSRSRRLYAAAARQLIPEVVASDLVRGGSGIRAQAVFANGQLADDFVFADDDRALHVLNAPSPAATACLAIGDRISSRLLQRAD
jgi:L-2-hydroxyglutarate oxidase LhgO